VATTAQTNRLRALLQGGEDTERDLARATLTESVLVAVARRREPRQASHHEQGIKFLLRREPSRESGDSFSLAPNFRRGVTAEQPRLYLCRWGLVGFAI